uniref:Uncharacterized protein n=1 Tax=Ananas comosus var. bracteatus TaxID=296719 RepID=A0A6V7NEV6_ANACO|nr:unnamed protein product [Ananas comosus var. bracteatus]
METPPSRLPATCQASAIANRSTDSWPHHSHERGQPIAKFAFSARLNRSGTSLVPSRADLNEDRLRGTIIDLLNYDNTVGLDPLVGYVNPVAELWVTLEAGFGCGLSILIPGQAQLELWKGMSLPHGDPLRRPIPQGEHVSRWLSPECRLVGSDPHKHVRMSTNGKQA